MPATSQRMKEIFRHLKSMIGSSHEHHQTLFSLEQAFTKVLKSVVFGKPTGKAPGTHGCTARSRWMHPSFYSEMLVSSYGQI
jgi:hypothetical protein